MKKYLLIALVAVAFLSFGGSVSAAAGDSPDSKLLGYRPLEPIPNLTLGNASVDLPTLLSNLFRVLFSVGALMAVVMLVLGGISYMTSTVVSIKVKAKERLQAALFGLLILAGSYLILVTINPQLVVFTFSVPATQSRVTPKNTVTDTNGYLVGVPAATCSSGIGLGGNTNNLALVEVTISNAYKAYTATSACGKQIEARLTGGVKLNTTGTSVLILSSSKTVTEHSGTINDFTKLCTKNHGQKVTFAGNTSNGDLMYICLKQPYEY
jgi:hypothetical protein